MTIVLCLNFGDHIYLAADSLVSVRDKATGELKPMGYRFKLYQVSSNCNAVIGFSGLVQHACDVIGKVKDYAQLERETLSEEGIFNALPGILEESSKSWSTESKPDLQLIYASLTPNSRAYEIEKFPGLGIPPKTFCGKFWIDEKSGKVECEKGNAIHVPSHPDMKMVSLGKNNILMDAFAIGIGANELRNVKRSYYSHKYSLPGFAKRVIPRKLATFFAKQQTPGIGGAYQVATISEQGVQLELFDPRNWSFDGESIIRWGKIQLELFDLRKSSSDGASIIGRDDEGAFLVRDNETGQEETIKTIWDDRWDFELEWII